MQDTDPTNVDSPDAALAPWLRLAETPGVGPLTAAVLLDQFEHPRRIFAATLDELCQHVTRRQALALLAPPSDEAVRACERACAWRAAPGHHVLALDDPNYPPALRTIHGPPVVLYVVGNLALLRTQGVAMVGSRNASVAGQRTAQAFAHALSGCGVTIVSGLALGIDAAAHAGALEGPGSTVAVVGTGVDVVYPARNRALAHRIAEQGCIVSEYRLGTHVDAANFPRRNRIISGLAQAVLVVEAAARSGSLITARLAAEQGRDVLAIPGSIHAALSKGCHALIKQGAKLVESAADVLEELRPPGLVPWAPHRPQPEYMHDDLLTLLDGVAMNGHDLAARAGQDPASVAMQLLNLELAGRVERLPGGMFRSVPPQA